MRAAFINFGPIPHSVIRKNCSTEDWFMKTSLRVIDVRSSIKLLCCSRTELRLSSAIVCPNERVHFTCDRDHTHLIDFAHACSYYSRAATISFTELHLRLLFKGGYYSRCDFYSNKYGNATFFVSIICTTIHMKFFNAKSFLNIRSGGSRI